MVEYAQVLSQNSSLVDHHDFEHFLCCHSAIRGPIGLKLSEVVPLTPPALPIWVAGPNGEPHSLKIILNIEIDPFCMALAPQQRYTIMTQIKTT